ncbi:PF20097 family protein [Haloferula helveola]|uniref:PF20097 family protein n=1 Tax=Haloferula helveola TaxID=490095 RepID=UPI0030B1B674
MKPIVCPNCGNEMTTGQFRLRKSTWDWLFWGGGFSHLFFTSTGEKKPTISLGHGAVRPGHSCRECGSIVLLPRKRLPVPEWGYPND